MSNPKDKAFDCIAFKREVQARIYEETKDLSPEAQREYFRVKVDESPFAEYFRDANTRKEAA